MPSFGRRLDAIFDEFGQLCVGIDPHSYLLSEWGLPDSAVGVREFGLAVVEAAAGHAGIVKAQVAFFERHGAAGYRALEDVLAAARQAGLLVIADVKRGDLGTSVEAYGQAWLTPGSPLEADAMTMVAYQGTGSVAGPLALAEANGKGVFVLAATSNPDGADLQKAVRADGRTVAASIVDDVVGWNRTHAGQSTGSIGVVLGATVAVSEYGIDLVALGRTPVLAPGFGYQGAGYSQLSELYGSSAPYAVVSASRSILSAGPSGIAKAVAAQAKEVLGCRG
ncbi:orotidine-5'-phosphate decarboxylase [soil metagenome]